MQQQHTSNGWNRIKSVLVVGAAGMLGTELLRQLRGSRWFQQTPPPAVHGYDIAELDITDADQVTAALQDIRPDIVFNCAAFTDVDGCESNREGAFAVNAAGPGNLARVCRQINAELVHISTDFVFDGNAERPYRPEDQPNPISVYGASKLAGEERLRAELDDHLIVRTAWLFGPRGKNFVATIARAAREKPFLEVVDDQLGAPTCTMDLADALLRLVAANARGTLHFCNRGQCSWFEFAREIVGQCGLETEVRPIKSAQLNRPAPRPAWSVLDLTEYRQITAHTPRPWQDALRDYLAQITP